MAGADDVEVPAVESSNGGYAPALAHRHHAGVDQAEAHVGVLVDELRWVHRTLVGSGEREPVIRRLS